VGRSRERFELEGSTVMIILENLQYSGGSTRKKKEGPGERRIERSQGPKKKRKKILCRGTGEAAKSSRPQRRISEKVIKKKFGYSGFKRFLCLEGTKGAWGRAGWITP